VRPPPDRRPIGLHLTRTAKAVSRAFDHALAEAGGSLPLWLVLLSLKSEQPGMQRDLAAAIGVEGPTLTHHLNRMEAAGLVIRRPDPANRRVHQVELTPDGDAAFDRLRQVVVAFDRRLRTGISADEATVLAGLLDRLERNAAGQAVPSGPATPTGAAKTTRKEHPR
jgi:MarR family transcriptional regulator for hemolysin